MNKTSLSIAAIFALANGVELNLPVSMNRLISKSGKLNYLLEMFEKSGNAFADPCAVCHSKTEGTLEAGKGPISGKAGGSYSKEAFCSESLCRESLMPKGTNPYGCGRGDTSQFCAQNPK